MKTRFTIKQVRALPNRELTRLWRSFKHSRQYKTTQQKENQLTVVDRERILDELCCRLELLERWLSEDLETAASH